MAVGPQRHIPRRLPHRGRQGKGRAAELRVLRKKAVGDALVLLRQDGAGGVHQGSAGPHIPGGVVQNGPLEHRQGKERIGLLVPDVRLFADDPEARAGGVHQHRVEGSLPLRPEYPAVGGGSTDTGEAQPLRALPDALELVLVKVAGDDLSPVLHGEGGGEGLAPRRGAHVQHAVAGPHAGRQGQQPGRRVLDQEFPRLEGGQRRQVAGVGELQAAGHPGMGPDRYAGLRQLRRQALRVGPQGIHLDRQGRRCVVCRQERLCLRSQDRQEPLHQPLGMTVSNRERLCLLPVRDGRQTALVPGELPQHRIHQAGCPGTAIGLCLLHRLVDGGAVRHLVQIQDLIGPDPQDLRQGRLEAVELLGAIGSQVEVQQQPVLHDAVDDPAAQRRLRACQAIPPELRAQRRIRPGPGSPAAHQDPEGRVPGAGGAHRLPPRSFPPPRPTKISTYRSSCSRLMRSAAT